MIKDVPFFPLYAANTLASRPFRMMTLEQRGLWITLMMEFWVNGSLPANKKQIAILLGIPEEILLKAFTNLQTFTLSQKGEEIFSQELEDYREKYMSARQKQSAGGKEGAEKKKIKRQKLQELESNKSQPQGIPKGQPEGSLIQFNSSHIKSGYINSNQLIKEEMSKEVQAWIDDFDKAPDLSSDYLKASKG